MIKAVDIRRSADAKARKAAHAQARSGIWAEYVLVTPEKARLWLRNNRRNRRMRPSQIARLADHMRKRRFVPSNDSICFAEDGLLLNGQHRLIAIVETGIEQEMLVQYGLPLEAFQWLDAQARRSLADHLNLLGVDYYEHKATIARRLASYAKSRGLNDSVVRTGNNGSPGSPVFVDMEDQLDVALQYGPVADAAKMMASANSKTKLVSATSVGFVYSLFAPWWSGTDDFVEKVVTGYGLERGDPAAVFRTLAEKNAAKMKHQRFDLPTMTGYLILAANAATEGKRMTKLQWPKSGYPQPAQHTHDAIRAACGWNAEEEA